MKFADARLLADENVHPGVIGFLRNRGQDIVDVFQTGLAGSADEVVLAAERRGSHIRFRLRKI